MLNIEPHSLLNKPITKILLVDDRRENLLALESLLRDLPTEIYQATSGRDALELLLQHRFAVALLDVQMPEINGFELAELMRGMDSTREIPIIFLTAGAIDPKHTFRGYEAGAVDFLYKPLDARIVKSKVKVYLRLEEQRLQIVSQMEQLQAAVRSREEFLSIASHELRTPLTSMSLQFQTARRSIRPEAGILPTTEKLIKTFDMANRQVGKLTRLIDDLLDISRIQAGKLSINREPKDLTVIIKEAIERLVPQLNSANVPVSLDFETPFPASFDENRIEQVVTNLITNVIKYAPDAPMEVRLWREGDRAFFTVKDNGPGIPEH
ncbi:MAG: hybrid sensor histidine kinase/response regulator, partial [Proteobacteria bacterium]